MLYGIIIFFSSHMSIYLKLLTRIFVYLWKIRKQNYSLWKVRFPWVFFNYYFYFLSGAVLQYLHSWLTMLILPFFIIKHTKSRSKAGSFFCMPCTDAVLCIRNSMIEVLAVQTHKTAVFDALPSSVVCDAPALSRAGSWTSSIGSHRLPITSCNYFLS